jgi:hypothetical protein
MTDYLKMEGLVVGVKAHPDTLAPLAQALNSLKMLIRGEQSTKKHTSSCFLALKHRADGLEHVCFCRPLRRRLVM